MRLLLSILILAFLVSCNDNAMPYASIELIVNHESVGLLNKYVTDTARQRAENAINSQIITSDAVLGNALRKLFLPYDARTIAMYRDSVSVYFDESSSLVHLIVKQRNGSQALMLADTIAACFSNFFMEREYRTNDAERTAIDTMLAGCKRELDILQRGLELRKNDNTNSTNLQRALTVREKEYIFLLEKRANVIIARAGIISPVRILHRARLVDFTDLALD